jgi:hypothetical protein
LVTLTSLQSLPWPQVRSRIDQVSGHWPVLIGIDCIWRYSSKCVQSSHDINWHFSLKWTFIHHWMLFGSVSNNYLNWALGCDLGMNEWLPRSWFTYATWRKTWS